MNQDAETPAGKEIKRYRDPILSYPTQAQTHDEFRRVCRRGFMLHDAKDGIRTVRQGQVRGKAAVKAAKKERRELRLIREDIRVNGL